MAAIIAQMARAKRERMGRNKVDSSKSTYTLEPFDKTFKPYVSKNIIFKISNMKIFCIS